MSGAASAAGAAVRRVVPSRAQWPFVVWLVVVWVALWGDLSAANVLAGLGLALVLKTALPLPELPVPHRVRVLALARLVAYVAGDLVVSSFHVAWLALRPGRPPGVAVLAIQLVGRSRGAQALVAELVSLVPGSLVIDLDPDSGLLQVHVLGVEGEADLRRSRQRVHRLEQRVLAAFEPPAAPPRRSRAGAARAGGAA